MGIVAKVNDALVSLVNNMGKAGYDKAASTEYVTVQWTDQQLIDAYRSTWLARKIVNIPAFDSFRRWRNWQAKETDIGLIEAEEKRLGLQQKLLECKIHARLFGGAALYLGTGELDPSRPLDPESIKKGGLRFINVMRRRDLNAGEIVKNPESDWYNRPEFYELTTGEGRPNVRIHASRLVIMTGDDLPDEELAPAAYRGWGDSVLVSTMEAIKNADATAANIASLIFEAKVDVIKVPDLMNSLAHPEYEQRLLQRFGLASTAKGIHGMLMLDGEEEYQQKSASFATLPDILDRFLQVVSGAADIPATRLLGQSPAGMNSTGESDLRNYYDRVQAIQTIEVTPAIYVLDECLIRSALGARPDDLHYIWASLWQVSDKERAEIGKANAETIDKLNNTGLYPPEALANAGANMLVENSIMPGLIEAIEEAGGLPDYELEAEQELENERLRIEAAAKGKGRPVSDASPKSLYVRRDVVNSSAIRSHYEKQGLEVTVSNLHITIIYSNKPVDWFAVGEAWDSKLTLSAGGARNHALFGPPGLENSLVLMVKSNELEWRHRAFIEAGAISSFPEYQPHITLRYKDGDGIDWEDLEPYRGEIVLGPEIFEEVKDD